MATLVDLRSEPAVEELSRQILSEAKLWEAIQEARVELLRQQRQNKAVSLQELFIGFPPQRGGEGLAIGIVFSAL